MDAREALRRYLADNDLKPATFASSLPYDKANFHRLLNNPNALPSLNLASRIERATQGRIPAAAWMKAA